MSRPVTVGGVAPHRINAMILRYWYLLLSSWPRLLELVYWPALLIFTWGVSAGITSPRTPGLAHAPAARWSAP